MPVQTNPSHKAHPLGMLRDQSVAPVLFSRIDLISLLEHTSHVSVMHRTFCSLKKISELQSLNLSKLSDVPESEAVLVSGNFGGNGPYVSFVWARAKSSQYRKALNARLLTSKITALPMASNLHADHIVNRASLRDLYEQHDPWVMLFEVPDSANSGFGSLVERVLPRYPDNTSQVLVEPLHLFKLFCTDLPRNKVDLKIVMKHIQGQVPPSIATEMENAFSVYLEQYLQRREKKMRGKTSTPAK